MTFNLSISEIIKAVKAVDFTHINNNIYINEISTDSRKILADKSHKSLFFAIKGEKFDGHDFMRLIG